MTHAAAVVAATRTVKDLRHVFDRLGNTEHPRGRVLSAYRQARRAMSRAANIVEVQQGLRDLRLSLVLAANATMTEAVELGMRQADREIIYYGLPIVSPYRYQPATELAAWLSVYDAQVAQVIATYATSGDLVRIVGDDSRVGLLSPSPVVRSGAGWLTQVAAAAWLWSVSLALDRMPPVNGAPARSAYVRQAVAAIDERTTDCCLRVHGQVAELDGDFRLDGTPRYADRMRNPPFHDFCRTATCLVRRDEAGDQITDNMVSAARREIAARAPDDNRQRISPAHATSGRRG